MNGLKWAGLLVIASSALGACSSDGDSSAAGGSGGSGAAGASGSTASSAGSSGSSAAGPVYAVESLVFGMSAGDSSTSYVVLLDSLASRADVTLDSAREFPGYAPLDTVAGKLYAGSGEAPQVTGFEIGSDLSWHELDTVSFGNFTTASLDGDVLVDANKGFAALADKNYVAWDPGALSLGSLMPLSADIPSKRGDFLVQRGYGHELVGDLIFQPYYWSDAAFQSFSGTSQIAVIDAAAGSFAAANEAPCPHLHITTQDEDGNLYFSNGVASIPPVALDDTQPHNCMVRVNAGDRAIDPAFTVDFKDLTDGREGSNLFYIGNGLAFFNVYHAERDKLTADSTYSSVMYSANYHLWTLDLKTMSAKPMAGIDYTGGQFVAFHLGDEIFVAVPNAAYSSTDIYAVSADGVAEKRFAVQGWAFKMLKVR